MKRVRTPSTKDGWYEIHPGDAQQLLDKRGLNRSISESKAKKIADEIMSGRFFENGETMIFANNEQIIDGQHRLRAVVLANKPIVSYCVFGIPSRFVATIDDGAKRTGGDVLHMNGFKYSLVCASISKLLYIYENGSLSAPQLTNPTNRQILETVKKNPDISKSALFIESMKEGRKVIAPSIAGFCHLMAARIDQEKAEEFFRKLATGEGLAAKNPILVLRNRFLSGDRSKISTTDKIAIMIKTWNAFVSGREIKLVRYTGRAGGESFPMFLDKDAE